MAWNDFSEVLPSAYINFKSNQDLAITYQTIRGTVVLPLQCGTKGKMYLETNTSSELAEAKVTVNATSKMLIKEALKNAKEVVVYALGEDTHTLEDVQAMLEALLIVNFNTIAYPYETEGCAEAIANWVKEQRAEENPVQAVLVLDAQDHEGIINVGNAYKLKNGTILTPLQATAWVAGATAGARANQSNTAKIVQDAIDVAPRMTKAEKKEAIKAGKFIFEVNNKQIVSVVIDINSLTTYAEPKATFWAKNRVIRVMDAITADVKALFDANIKGKEDNSKTGRQKFRGILIEFFQEMERLGCIEDFDPSDVTVEAVQNTKDSVLANIAVIAIDAIEKMYMTVNVQ